MLGSSSTAGVGQVTVVSVSGRGFTPDELVEGVLDKLVVIDDTDMDEAQYRRAIEIRNNVRKMLVSYGEQCIKSHRT